MKKVLTIVILLVVVASCKCPKIVTDTQVVRDEIIRTKEILVRDTIIVTDTARIVVEVPVEKITEIPVIKYRKNARVILQKIHDTIRVTAECDSIKFAAKIRDQITKEQKVKEVITTEIVYERYVPWTIKFLATIGGLTLGAVILKLISNKYFKS